VRFPRRNSNPKPANPAESDPKTEQTDDAQQSRPGGAVSPGSISPSKGRPTPKRREAETRRRGPAAPPPRTQREAMRRSRGSKEERRAERAERRARMLAGDDRYLLPRDRGPVRAYVRDLVDSRRHLMGLFVPMALAVLLSVVARDPMIQYYVSLATMAVLLVIIVEGVFFGRLVTQRVRKKFPDAKDSGLGLGWYAFSRATMLRRFRAPRPRVKYGDDPR
jgi:hypothetical protein